MFAKQIVQYLLIGLKIHLFKRRVLLVPLLLLLLSSCSNTKTEKKFTIGFSQCQGGDDWRKTMLAEMKRELSLHDNVDFIYRDAEADSKKQLAQIRELANLHVDLLIISPNEVQPLQSEIEKVFESGIPVVLVDRGINSKKYTAFIGASNFEVGQNAGMFTANTLGGKGKVLEVAGLPDATPFIARHNGFVDIISQHPGITLLQTFNDHDTGYQRQLANKLLSEKGIDLIFAQTDYIALQVYKICEETGVDKKVKIVGIDGLPSDTLGVGMVADKILVATVLYPTGGQESIITALDILEHRPYKKENKLATNIIDSTNVRIMKLQYDKVIAQQQDIDKRQRKIDQQIAITKNQNNIIVAISITLALALVLGTILFYYLSENKKINARLALQNEEILSQRNQVIALSKKAKEATDAKFNFFTNISHELCTPLTLILGPLQDVLASAKLAFSAKTQLEMVNKNAMRLLRLVNQLMDFRKIEEKKMRIKASENSIGEFVTEIANAFTESATSKKIAYRIDVKDPALKVWFDINMLDKILFNILSNAFKYTNEQGAITVSVSKDPEEKNALIKIEDTGIGMSPETLAHAFDLFYQGNEGTYKGTGLGLALSKELITLHHGSIKIKSEKFKGALFEVSLPLGKAHFQENEIVQDAAVYALNYEDTKIYTNESEAPLAQVADDLPTTAFDQSVLVIEDNPEIRLFIKNQLGKHYEIIDAENGNVGLNLAYEIIPDIIISDVMLPGKDGMAITETLKNDIRTSHIPIIILTSKGTMEQQIEGLKLNADAYIVKPFNIQYLEESIRSLLKNRETLRGHYSSELPNESGRNLSKKIDRKFVNEFSSIVESNISNEDFSVNDICKALGISRVQMYRKVKAVLGYNVNDYILDVRMQKAKYLLLNEELSIAQVSDKVGFSSQAYFSTVFKAKFGFTPKAFKEQ